MKYKPVEFLTTVGILFVIFAVGLVVLGLLAPQHYVLRSQGGLMVDPDNGNYFLTVEDCRSLNYIITEENRDDGVVDIYVERLVDRSMLLFANDSGKELLNFRVPHGKTVNFICR